MFIPTFDEEASNYTNISEFISQINPKLIQGLQIHNLNEKNENNNGEEFEKVFNKVFNESNTNNSIGKENNYKIFGFKIFKHISLKRDKDISLKNDEKNHKFFPFTQGEGIQNCLRKMGYLMNYITPIEINIQPMEQNVQNNTKFQVIDYSKDKKGRIKRQKKKRSKKKRKFKPDDIRKKIKSRFHKVLKNIINNYLIEAGSKLLFDFLPQYFISNITIKLNKIALDYTYEDLIKIDFEGEISNPEKNEINMEKYNRNLKVLNYLDKNPDINELSLFSKIRKMKYSQILEAYFQSKEFEDSIIELHKKGERKDYIENYINKGLSYIHFFQQMDG